jgi:hypothetical protein
MSNEEVINKRISNKVWVDHMGGNFVTKYPLIYKDGICKKAQKFYMDGRFKEMIDILETAFNLNAIRAHFDPKFAKKYQRMLEEEHKKKEEDEHQFEGHEKKKDIIPDSYDNPKNRRICEEVYYMIKDMDDYKKEKRMAARKLEQEIKMITAENNKKTMNVPVTMKQQGGNLVATNTTNTSMEKTNAETIQKLSFIKDRYFKFFKSIMCPLKYLKYNP